MDKGIFPIPTDSTYLMSCFISKVHKQMMEAQLLQWIGSTGSLGEKPEQPH